jgi:hypothetical protein
LSNGGDINGADFIAYRNHANLLTCRAFTRALKLHPDPIGLLMRITGRSQATCYKYTQELRQRKKGDKVTGSGLPSPLHQLCEMVKALVREERAEGFTGISFSFEIARYAFRCWERLHSTPAAAACDERSVGKKLDLLGLEAAQANFKLGDRLPGTLPLDEQKEIYNLLLNAETLVGELVWIFGRRIDETAAKHTGSPMPQDRRERVPVREAALTAPGR